MFNHIEKRKIGVLDMYIGGVSIINELCKTFPNDDIIYVNDLQVENYEGMQVEKIEQRVKENIQYLVNQNVSIIIVVNDTIIEYCEEYLKTVTIPVISIVDEIIDYVNEKYEHKNIAFLACDSILEANIYQKNFRYNHLYNLSLDSLLPCIYEGKMKTSESFAQTKVVVAPIFKKEVDVLVPSMPNVLLFKTEILEFLKNMDIVYIDKILCDKAALILNENDNLNNQVKKKKGKIYIVINKAIEKNIFNPLLFTKFDIITKEGEKINVK